MPLACIVLPRQGIVVEGPPYLLDLGVSLLNFPFNICLILFYKMIYSIHCLQTFFLFHGLSVFMSVTKVCQKSGKSKQSA